MFLDAGGQECIDTGMAADGGCGDGEGVGQERVIGVEKAEEVASDAFESGIAGAGDASVNGEGEEHETGVAPERFFEETLGGRVRAVKHKKKLGFTEGLASKGGGASAKVRRGDLENRDDDGNQRARHSEEGVK